MTLIVGFFALVLISNPAPAAENTPYTLPQVLTYPFPSELVASPSGQRIAWALFKGGERSLWTAEGPDFRARKLVTYGPDDGQELTHLVFTADGDHLLYVRGGDHGANWPAEGNLQPNPQSLPQEPKMEIWSAALAGGDPVLLAEGDAPAPSPQDDRIAFEKGKEIWVVSLDRKQEPRRLFFARGESVNPTWSPDGSTLAFVSDRGSHGYIGLFRSTGEPLRYMAPSTSKDTGPRFSPDGTKLVFIRRPGEGGPATPPLEEPPSPWSIWVADVARGEAREIWRSPDTARGSYPRTLGGANLSWAGNDRLVFLAESDGWPHLYSVSALGGDPLLLTPGEFMVEYVTMSPHGRFIFYNANIGPDPDDIERRHLYRVSPAGGAPEAVTTGEGIEWAPVVTADGNTLAYFGSDARRPPRPHVSSLTGSGARALALDQVPEDFPAIHLVTPEHVVFDAPDGTPIHGQLFKTGSVTGRRPAIVFVHGGPPRQMLLGWHYMFYYANTYALNQYLASRGNVVLSVNYRLGIGYGRDFQHPPRAGYRGASEYQDVLAGARYLAARPDVDPDRIGIWGGSYGGYLTALALGRNSDVFAAGVDIHGVHDRRDRVPLENLRRAALSGDGITEGDLDEALRVAWESSPASSVDTWRSPVLFIHGDDDRNVGVSQTVDLVERLRAKGVSYEEIIIPDDIHDFLLFRSWLRASEATADFFDRRLGPSSSTEDGRLFWRSAAYYRFGDL